MISVVVYGRNDAHGYNLHKRAALSLNSLARALTDPDDEIVFVDWNTPDGIPPFPVAISDCLSDECLRKLTIVRVPAYEHDRFLRGRSTKPTVEPVARNVGIRRANPVNGWILSTNTDVLLDVAGGSLSDIARELGNGYYASPRYELPEWLWESLPRTDPEAVAVTLERLGVDGFPLNVVRSYPHALFDAPGDFQLFHRRSLEALGCFDETMVKGWHVDSNIAVRFSRAFAPPQSLEETVRVFHCNHTREVTHFHKSAKRANDLNIYVSGYVPPVARSGRAGWGLPEVDLPKLSVRAAAGTPLTSLGDLVPVSRGRIYTDFTKSSDRICGVPESVSLPFIIDHVIMAPGAPVIYVGDREEMTHQLERTCAQLGRSLLVGTADATGIDLQGNPIVLVDFTPPHEVHRRQADSLADLTPEDKTSLRKTFARLENILQAPNLRPSDAKYLVLNAEANPFERALEGVFDLLPVQYYSRVRPARLRDSYERRTRAFERPARFGLSLLEGVTSVHRRRQARLIRLGRDESDVQGRASTMARRAAWALSSAQRIKGYLQIRLSAYSGLVLPSELMGPDPDSSG